MTTTSRRTMLLSRQSSNKLFLPFFLAWIMLSASPNLFVTAFSFHSTTPTRTTTRWTFSSALQASSNDEDDKDRRKQEILAQEALNQANLKASAAELESWDAATMDRMMAQVDGMSAAEKAELESMGMDASTMKQAMQMMRDNPQMKQQVAEMMNSMTPQEIMEQSRAAQQVMKQANAAGGAAVASAATDAQVVETKAEEKEEDDEEDEEEEPIELDPAVLDAMFRVGELMSEPPTGDVTLAAFSSLPPIATISGTGDDDLTTRELRECWSQGSLGATRVDRQGFERVWRAIQDDYYNDIVEEARERLIVKKKKRGSTTSKPANAPSLSTPSAVTGPASTVGANLTPEQLQAQIKNMKDEDMIKMFEQMSNMGPAEEARLKAMGVDPAMMKKSAEALQSNPLLRKAATMMMKNTSAEQLMKASQEAQAKMANMSEEEKQKLMDNLK